MVEDEEDDGEAGPELPPDFEEEDPDDEEGRFFGGGMEQKTAQAMEYIDENEREDIAVSGLRLQSLVRRPGTDISSI